jgi:serine protease
MSIRQSAARPSCAPRLLSSAAFAAVLLLGACGSDKGSSAPASGTDSADVVSDMVVVDFKDGTTKQQYDSIEKAWGIDVEFNSIEGERSGITLGRVDPAQREALLARIRKDPGVEAAEPLFAYRASMTPIK